MTIKQEIISPITKGKTTLIETIPISKLVKKYQDKLKIETSIYFKNYTDIYIYECFDTKYRFYYPYDISGDSIFYEQLQDSKDYYMEWKWEHQIGSNHINEGMNVLEIGSARGAFLQKLLKEKNNNLNVVGLELNADAAEFARKKGLNVLTESLLDFAPQNRASFDVVCAFQVLEHISEVTPFLLAAIECLKQGGKLIIGVPNNQSFSKYIPMNSLNMPPHHMGLWDEYSLENIAPLFGLKKPCFFFEPLAPIHLRGYFHAKIIQLLGNNIFSKMMLIPLLPIIYLAKKRKANCNIIGHTMVAIYEKK